MKNSKAELEKNLSLIANRCQREASDPDVSVWVEASAGTGKTKVLADRVLRLLLNGVHPSKILCLTYTKAAAANMKDRIAGKLGRWAIIEESALRDEIEDLVGKLDSKKTDKTLSVARRLFALYLDSTGSFKIQTIHSFCQDVLKRFPIEAKVSPYFEVIDDRKANEILTKIKKDILVNQADSNINQAIEYIVHNSSEGSFLKILKSITENRTKYDDLLKKYSDFARFRESLAASLGVDPADNVSASKKRYWQQTDMSRIIKIKNALQHGSQTDIEKSKLIDKILGSITEESSFDEYCNIFVNSSGEPRSKIAHNGAITYDGNVIDYIIQEQKLLREKCEELKNISVLKSTLSVLQIAKYLIEKYNQYKQLSGKMDYEDLIVLTRDLLQNKSVADWVLYKLDGGIDHILVDEAQDNSPNQWSIIKSLSAEFFAGEGQKKDRRTVFAVGDRKQSIYGFQGADPDSFEEMRKYFSSKSQNFKTVNLDISFRSAPAILHAVNTVFKDDKNKKGVVPFSQEINHLAFHGAWGGQVEVWPIIETDKPEKNEPEDYDFSKLTSAGILAKELAKRIKDIVDAKIYLDSKQRYATYGDFMVLLQKRKGRFLPEFMHECRNLGIPLAGADRLQLLEQIAIQDLISLGKFLLLPTDDLSLCEVLKSPLCNLNDDDLIKLCCNRGNATVWSRLSDFSEYSSIYAFLQELLNMIDYVRPYELYNHILSTLGGRKKFVARLGEEIEDCLDVFMSQALSFEQEHIPSLQMFIGWIEKDDVEIKREIEQINTDSLRIMTVHGSKGLQSPIVILPDALRVLQNKKESGVLDNEFMYYPLSAENYSEKCIEIRNKMHNKEMNEYRRLLYVAMTRAEDRLFICGYKNRQSKEEESWYTACINGVNKIGKTVDGVTIYEESGDVAEKDIHANTSEHKKQLPEFSWLHDPLEEESPLSRPYRPSAPNIDDEDAVSPIERQDEYRYKRGTLIHKLLQYAGQPHIDISVEKINLFIEQNAPELSKKTKQSISEEVSKLLLKSEFTDIFGKDSKAEVPIIGEIDGKIISAQIDRLYVTKNRVVIVDFKTNRPAATNVDDVPELYLNQLHTYKKLLQKIYPNKIVETYILWTNTAEMMKIV